MENRILASTLDVQRDLDALWIGEHDLTFIELDFETRFRQPASHELRSPFRTDGSRESRRSGEFQQQLARGRRGLLRWS